MRLAHIMARMHVPGGSQVRLRIALACLGWAMVDGDGAAHLPGTVHEEGELEGNVQSLTWPGSGQSPCQDYVIADPGNTYGRTQEGWAVKFGLVWASSHLP